MPIYAYGEVYDGSTLIESNQLICEVRLCYNGYYKFVLDETYVTEGFCIKTLEIKSSMIDDTIEYTHNADSFVSIYELVDFLNITSNAGNLTGRIYHALVENLKLNKEDFTQTDHFKIKYI